MTATIIQAVGYPEGVDIAHQFFLLTRKDKKGTKVRIFLCRNINAQQTRIAVGWR